MSSAANPNKKNQIYFLAPMHRHTYLVRESMNTSTEHSFLLVSKYGNVNTKSCREMHALSLVDSILFPSLSLLDEVTNDYHITDPSLA